jgi:hypothetical protein
VSRRLVTLLLVALAALALGACGNKKARTLHGTTEGVYIDVGDLKYQVQISRLLNPTDREDRDYLVDLPADQKLGANENWFAVFMRVENDSDKAAPATDAYSIRDTEGNVYKPITMGPKNVFAYRPAVLQPKDVLPLPSTGAAENTIQGAMVLFKIPVANFQNRPLELQIPPPAGVGGGTGTVDLDV